MAALCDGKLPQPIMKDDVVFTNTGNKLLFLYHVCLKVPRVCPAFLLICNDYENVLTIQCQFKCQSIFNSNADVLRKLSLTHCCIPVTVGLFDCASLLDPSRAEEEVQQGAVTFVFAMPSAQICFMHQVRDQCTNI